MNTKHTPGPWSYDDKINRVYSVPTNLCVAAIHIAGNPACELAWPDDAHLIAAAPEMLEALKEAHNALQRIADLGEAATVERARFIARDVLDYFSENGLVEVGIARAIAKAEGGAA